MNIHEIESNWDNPSNWKWGCIYACSGDPRLFVPKKNKSGGWTMNFGKKNAIPVLVLLILFVTSPILIASPFGPKAIGIASVITIFFSAITVAFVGHLSSAERASSKEPNEP